jgi:hypothetical protein
MQITWRRLALLIAGIGIFSGMARAQYTVTATITDTPADPLGRRRDEEMNL